VGGGRHHGSHKSASNSWGVERTRSPACGQALERNVKQMIGFLGGERIPMLFIQRLRERKRRGSPEAQTRVLLGAITLYHAMDARGNKGGEKNSHEETSGVKRN